MKIRLKIALSMLCLLSILFGAGASALISVSFNAAYKQEKAAALDSYQMALNALSVMIQLEGQPDSEGILEALDQLRSQDALTMQAFRLSDADGVIYRSDDLVDTLKPVDTNLKVNQSVSANFERGGKHYLQIYGAFNAGKETLYLDAIYDISSIYTMRADQQTVFYRVYGILIVVCALLAYLVTWLLTRPLMRLSRASEELAKGNLSYRAKVTSDDEIGSLSNEFNVMASQIERGFTSLTSTMEQQERFMASFAHELKTPMTSIIGFAELIQNQTLTPEEQMDAAHYIFSEGKRLEGLSFKLLEILANEQTAVQMVPTSPAALISEMVEHLRPIYDREGIALHQDTDTAMCMMEPDLVKSLLINLVDNARKAIEGSGHSRGHIYIESRVSEDGCLIRVSDNGKGIPPESLEHLTEAFYRADKSRAREQGGAGLGLMLCAKIAEVHHGTLHFESREGIGTHVIAELKGGRS